MPDIYVNPDAIPAEIMDQLKVSLERRAWVSGLLGRHNAPGAGAGLRHAMQRVQF